MAVDIVFETEKDREEAVAEIREIRPEYHVYIGENYETTRIHLQGWKFQQEPQVRDL